MFHALKNSLSTLIIFRVWIELCMRMLEQRQLNILLRLWPLPMQCNAIQTDGLTLRRLSSSGKEGSEAYLSDDDCCCWWPRAPAFVLLLLLLLQSSPAPALFNRPEPEDPVVEVWWWLFDVLCWSPPPPLPYFDWLLALSLSGWTIVDEEEDDDDWAGGGGRGGGTEALLLLLLLALLRRVLEYPVTPPTTESGQTG